jgi:dihydroorotase
VTESFDLLLRGGTCLTPTGRARADVGIRGGAIAAVGDLGAAPAADVFEAKGLHVLPGVIDTQVHFREPGNEHKEDLETGTRAALLGGVTGVFEMPNTSPPTTSAEAIADKLARAKGRAWCNIAFYVGATAENADALGDLERLPGCCGVKVFMGSSTGGLLVSDDETLERVMRSGSRRMAIHSEDEARLRQRRPITDAATSVHAHEEWRDVETAVRATRRLLDLSERTKRPIHVLHVSTAEEMDLLAGHKDLASAEVTPQHLTLEAPDCYDRLGTLAQMNPPIRGAQHRRGLWRALEARVVDVIGSDHAPHTREEKANAYPNTPSGMPGVQTLVPVLLNHVAAGRLTLERLVELTSEAPAHLFGISGKHGVVAGSDADLTLVDLGAKREITDSWIASRCGWTPFDGMQVTGWPRATIIGGRIVMRDDEVLGEPAGAPMQFNF